MSPFGNSPVQERGPKHDENGSGPFNPQSQHVVRAIVDAHGSVQDVIVQDANDDPNLAHNHLHELYFANRNYLDDTGSRSSESLSDYLTSPPCGVGTDSEIDDSSISSIPGVYPNGLPTRTMEYFSNPNYPNNRVMTGDEFQSARWMNVIYDISDAPEFPVSVVLRDNPNPNLNAQRNINEDNDGPSGIFNLFSCCFKGNSENNEHQ